MWLTADTLTLNQSFKSVTLHVIVFNPLLFLHKSLLPGQEDSTFFSGHLHLHAKLETGIPYRKKKYKNYIKKERIIILSDFIHQTSESYILFTQLKIQWGSVYELNPFLEAVRKPKLFFP
jgi:hypothetical protein